MFPLKVTEFFPSLIITGKQNNTIILWCVTTQGCFRLDGKFWVPNIPRPSTTTVEAPFCSPLQPKLPLTEYLMAHNGKTLFITVQPSGFKVHKCAMLKLSSTGKVHACRAIHPKINKGYYIFFLSGMCFFRLSVCSDGIDISPFMGRQHLSGQAFFQPRFGARFASSWE